MKKVSLVIILIVCLNIILANEFDINEFTNPYKYNWENYEQRISHRIDREERQELLQIYNMNKQSITSNMIKSAFVPGWGQISAHSYIRGQVILGVEIVALGGCLFLYTRAMDKYDKYKNATQVDEINSLYDEALEPYTLSMALLGLYGLVWGYNLYDSAQSTEGYNAQLWNKLLKDNASRRILLTPTGIELRF